MHSAGNLYLFTQGAVVGLPGRCQLAWEQPA